MIPTSDQLDAYLRRFPGFVRGFVYR